MPHFDIHFLIPLLDFLGLVTVCQVFVTKLTQSIPAKVSQTFTDGLWQQFSFFLLLRYYAELQFFSKLRRISCHGRNHSQASCEYSLTIFLCCQHHSEYLLLGSKFSTNLLFAASKCHVTMEQRGSSRCSKWPNRMGSLQW